MKKMTSRLLALALVLAMVCAMVPAAFAGDTGDTGNTGSSDASDGGAGGAATISWTGVNNSYEVDATIDLSAVKCSVEGHTVDFSTEDTDILTINGKTATAKAVGPATITATCKGAGCTATGTKTVTITAKQVTLSATAVATLAATKKSVAKGTAFTSISLPTTVATSQTGVNATITWTASDYKVNTLGDQTIRGTATLTSDTYALTGSTNVSTIITVQDTAALRITTQPAGGTYDVGDYATLSVAVTGGTAPYTYQWFKNNTAVTATGATYSYTSAAAATDSVYCVVTDKNGTSVTSTKATVTFSNTGYKLNASASRTALDSVYYTSATLTAQLRHDGIALPNVKYTFDATSGLSISATTRTSTINGEQVSIAVYPNSYATTTAQSVTVKAYVNNALVKTATVSFTVSATTGLYDFSVTASNGVYQFTSSDFYRTAYASYSSLNAPAYVTFSTPSGGYLRTYNGTHYTSNKYYLYDYNYNYNYNNYPTYPYSTSYTYNYSIEDLEFVLNNIYPTYTSSSYSSSYYSSYYNSYPYYYNTPSGSVAYTVHAYNGTTLYNGTVRVYNTGEINNGNIRYYVNTNGSVSLKESDFISFFNSQYSTSSYYTLSYVRFTGSNLNTTNGTLYDANRNVANSSTNYYVNRSTSYNSNTLNGMYFKAGSRTGQYTVSIPFTAYATNGTGRSGTMTIYVNQGSQTSGSLEITTAGKSFSDLVNYLRPSNVSYGSTLTNYYVKITGVTNGTLYNSSNTNASNVYGANTKYYFTSNSTNYVGNLFFVPSAGATTATVSYTVYRPGTTSYPTSTYTNGYTTTTYTYDAYGNRIPVTQWVSNYPTTSYTSDVYVDSGVLTFTVKGAASTSFYDLNQASWATTEINYMAQQGYIDGIGNNTFAPKSLMTRGQLVTILYRMAGKPTTSGSNKFSDVSSTQYYYDAVLWAASNGIVNGKGNGTFKPNDYITRQELAKILYGYAVYKNGTQTASGSIDSYPDKAQVASYATEAMAWAIGKGIISGANGKLAPNANANRATVAVMLYRFLTK